MQSKIFPILVASASLTHLSQGAILTDTFTGGLNPAIWNSSDGFTEGEGVVTATNDRFEFTASPAADLFDGNHHAGLAAFNVLSASKSWTVDVVAFLAPTEDFGTFGLSEAVGLTLSIENTDNSQDNLEISFAAGNLLPNGSSDKVFRSGLRNDGIEDPLIVSGLLGAIGATDIKLSFDHTTGIVAVSYDTGAGEIALGTHDISSWNLDSEENLTFALGGGVFSTDSSIQSTTIEALSGEAYFDNLVINNDTSVPEPSTLALGILGLMATLRRRR